MKESPGNACISIISSYTINRKRILHITSRDARTPQPYRVNTVQGGGGVRNCNRSNSAHAIQTNPMSRERNNFNFFMLILQIVDRRDDDLNACKKIHNYLNAICLTYPLVINWILKKLQAF